MLDSRCRPRLLPDCGINTRYFILKECLMAARRVLGRLLPVTLRPNSSATRPEQPTSNTGKREKSGGDGNIKVVKLRAVQVIELVTP